MAGDAIADDLLRRIAEALERLAPPQADTLELDGHRHFVWTGDTLEAVDQLQALPLDLLSAVDEQKARLVENTRRHANGTAAHDALLWGARGTGKSALVKSAVAAVEAEGQPLSLVQLSADHLASLPRLFTDLGQSERRFILYIDDIGFGEEDSEAPRLLRSMLEGGLRPRPDNVRIYATSNRRHIVPRHLSEQDDPVNPRDVVDDRLALSDRFGLRLGFHALGQDDYLAILNAYATHFGLSFDAAEALEWQRQRGARSGRIAWHYMIELAGRAGRTLTL